MKRPLLLLASICFLSLTGCSKDDPVVTDSISTEDPTTNPEEPESPIYFTFTARTLQADSNSEEKTWVVLHNSDGELLDYKKAEPGVKLIFESVDEPITDGITVTVIEKSVWNGDDIDSRVNSYMDIEKGAVWTQKPYNLEEPSGYFYFSAENVPDWKSFSVSSSDSFGAFGNSDYYYGFNNTDTEELFIREDGVRIFAEDDFIFLLTNTQGQTKYSMLPNVKDGDSISVDASKLLDFDKITKINVPQHSYLNFGVDALSFENGIQKSLNLGPRFFRSETPLETLELGYLNDFKDYRSYVSIRTGNIGYSYSKTGSSIDAFEFPAAPSFDLMSASLTDFRFATSASYMYQASSFYANEPKEEGDRSRNSTYWSVLSKPDSFKALVTLPEELLTESNVYFEDVKYGSTTIYTKSTTYEEAVDSQFSVSLPQGIVPLERESFSFSPAEEESAKYLQAPSSESQILDFHCEVTNSIKKGSNIVTRINIANYSVFDTLPSNGRRGVFVFRMVKSVFFM